MWLLKKINANLNYKIAVHSMNQRRFYFNNSVILFYFILRNKLLVKKIGYVNSFKINFNFTIW